MLVLRVLENTFDACALSQRTLEVISSTVCGYAADYVGDRGTMYDSKAASVYGYI